MGRGVAILGSTGSVGVNTIDVVSALSDQFHIVALAAHSNADALQAQIDVYKPPYAALTGAPDTQLVGTHTVDAADPLESIVELDEVDIVVVATTGHAALPAAVAALEAGKIVALANKETIVAGGPIVMPIARLHPGNLRPIDSEHSAVWQCLPDSGSIDKTVHRILLTASGGPFRGHTTDQLEKVDVQQALNHPTWSMGARITIDSATLMNKGFELIEANWLFNCPLDQITIVIHPQSLVHSMVEYSDGSILAHLSSHDMRIPIQYALTYPDRQDGPGDRLSLKDISHLDFMEPDFQTFPGPEIARSAAIAGGLYPAVLSKADELAVGAFLEGKIAFTSIVALVEEVLDEFDPGIATSVSLESIAETDAWTTRQINSLLDRRTRAQ